MFKMLQKTLKYLLSFINNACMHKLNKVIHKLSSELNKLIGINLFKARPNKIVKTILVIKVNVLKKLL